MGAAESPLGKVSDQTEMSMVALAARDALAEAGMTLADVDGVFANYMGEESSVQVAEYLGIQPRYSESSDLGGGSFESFVHHAALAISAGRCEVALIAFASRQRSRRSRGYTFPADNYSLMGQFESPSGLAVPMGYFALAAARHMYQYGTRPEHLAEIAVATRQWAQKNPKAWRREPLTIQDVLASAPICEPLHRDDVCLLTDGGGAVVVTTKERARDAATRAVQVLGGAESHTHWQISQMPDLTVTAGALSGREAMGMAGITVSDVDVLEIYDATTINVLLALEDLGFCEKGEGGPFVEGGTLAPGGSHPAQTSGGGLSYCHPGAFGILLLIEAVRQVRGEAGERQVPDADIALVHGIGGLMSCGSTLVLARG